MKYLWQMTNTTKNIIQSDGKENVVKSHVVYDTKMGAEEMYFI